MIAYSIGAALNSGLFDKVVVSTDDDEIAAIAEQYGASVPFRRPTELGNDFTPTIPVIAHAIQWLESEGVEIEAACCIYATAPFVKIQDLKDGWEIFESGKWDYVFSGTSFAFPIFRAFRKLESGGLQMFFPEHFTTRSQDLPESFHDAGQFYWGKRDAWLEARPLFGANSTLVELPRWRVQDIDTDEDWLRAERIFQNAMNES
jgi:N-acylneuraminate cytidylyltransferase